VIIVTPRTSDLALPGNSRPRAACVDMSREEGIRVLIPYIYHPSTPKERIDRDLWVRLRTDPSTETYTAQLEGIARWRSWNRLDQLRIPTLVQHGESDGLVPPENGRPLMSRIPGAQLEMLEGWSHLLFSDLPHETARLIGEFVERVLRDG